MFVTKCNFQKDKKKQKNPASNLNDRNTPDSMFMMLTIYAFPQVFDFTIAEDDVEILNGLHDGRHVSWDPSLIV